MTAKGFLCFKITCLLVAAISIIFSSSSASASLIGLYQFDGDLSNSSGYLPSMTAVNGTGTFSTQSVFGETKQVYSEGDNQQGLSLELTGMADKDKYTIVMDIKFNQVTSYDRLISFDNVGSDYGFYVVSSTIRFYSYTAPTTTPLTADTYFRIALTNDGTYLTGYTGGPDDITQQFYIDDSNNWGSADGSGKFLFYIDDNPEQQEENGTTTSRIWIFDEALSGSEIAALVPEPAIMVLVISGLAAVALRRRSQKH